MDVKIEKPQHSNTQEIKRTTVGRVHRTATDRVQRTMAPALVLVLLLSALALTSCGGVGGEPVEETDFILDTMCSVTLYDPADREIALGALDLCRSYEDMFTVDAVNNGKEQNPEVLEVIENGIEFGEMSAGKFDIAIGSISELWDFNSDDPTPPSLEQVESRLETVDFSTIGVSGSKVTTQDPDTKIDLGAIAKGYIGDQLKEYLKEQGVTQGIINLGGNIVTVGSKPDDEPWVIGVDDPNQGSSGAVRNIDVTGEQSIVTSGIYQRAFTYEGNYYHHIIDPDTGFPVETDLKSVTVVSQDGMQADAVSTSCMLLGYKEGRALIERLNLQAVFITENDEILPINI